MMKQQIRRTALVFLCVLLTGLLYLSGAKSDLLLFITAEDCAAADFSSLPQRPLHAVILQETKARTKESVRKMLAKAGVEDTEFTGFSKVKNRSADTLRKRWATKENIAGIASLLRRYGDDRIICYAADEEDRAFLYSFADLCAAAANDPECRMAKKTQDEYLREVPVIVDGITKEERMTSGVSTAWRDEWDDHAEYDLSGLPECDDEGFLTEGEYVLGDAAGGLWVYLSPQLRIVVTKHSREGYSWFEADIRRRPEGETLHIISSLNERGKDPAKLARETGLVLGINADYYQMRVNMKRKTGLIIRGGELIRESAGAPKSRFLPTLDTLLLDAEGGFRLDRAGEMDSEKAFALGAVDVLAFGPILVKDGHIRIMSAGYYYTKEPRTAVGLLGKNHYLMVVAEGRLSKSRGMTLEELSRLMAARGCTDAINLDGGHTSVLIFMGERLNRIGNLSRTGTTVPRNMSELLGIGTHAR